MTSYDVIVCGAGPAGAMAATTAAQAGLKVALLEKYPLPRHKTCGGGTPMTTQKYLYDLVPDAFVEENVLYMRHTWKFGDPHLAAINPPGTEQKISMWMMQRSIFDNTLVERAVKAGAELRDGLVVRSLEIEANDVRVVGRAMKSNTEFSAKASYVIGADGASGITAKAANLRQKPYIAVGMEVEHPFFYPEERHPDLQRDVAHLEYGAIPFGYAWIFPKANHLNIGAGIFRPKQLDARKDHTIIPKLKQTILGYMDALGIIYNPDQMQFYAHPLPIWSGKEPLHSPDGRVLLAGDAAGLINPLFGDGILHAIKSGAIAAQCLIEGKAAEYSDRIHQEFAPRFDPALKLAKVFYNYPSICYKLAVKQPTSTRTAARLLADELSFADVGERLINKVRQQLLHEIF
jgi:geranylgeranyl reductase family protein